MALRGRTRPRPIAIEDPNLGLTKTNALIAGLSLGLEVSPDTGCSWTTVGGPLAGQLVKDIVVRPDTPDTILAVTSTYGPDAGADGGAGYAQAVFSSTNDGAQWNPIGTHRSLRHGDDDRGRGDRPSAHLRVGVSRRERAANDVDLRLDQRRAELAPST